MNSNTCCFIGHRTIVETEELKSELREIIQELITEENVHTFLFGSKSRFNELCYELVTQMKDVYPHVKRVYVRAEYSDIDDSYKHYLLERYEDTYYPERMLGAGRAAYVERNCEMIDSSRFCIIYYDQNQTPLTRKSGSKIALDYAAKKGKRLIVVSAGTP